MSVWVVSDTHLNHTRIMEYCPDTRDFSCVEDMNEAIINRWNDRISPDDIVYHLGDVCMGQLDTIDKYLPRLNGHITLIKGNHDTKGRIARIQEVVGWEVLNIECIHYNGINFLMMHEKPEDMHGNSENVILYGHVHDAAPHGLQPDWTYHVGLDTNNLAPVNLHDIWIDVQEQRIKTGE